MEIPHALRLLLPCPRWALRPLCRAAPLSTSVALSSSAALASPPAFFRAASCNFCSGVLFRDGSNRSVKVRGGGAMNVVGEAGVTQRREKLLMLGIESSCDDTAAAVVTGDGKILSEVVSSQADLLVQYGGVVPKMAQERHQQVIDKVVSQALFKAGISELDISAVAVTIGPGLSLCLQVGVKKARMISRMHRLPWIGVHHMEAHALVARLIDKELDFPFLVLLISGGHNLLLLAQNVGQYIQLGTTVDDAIGEAFDKTARMLGLDLKKGGGPALEELALEGDPYSVNFSVPMRNHRDCNFSYAGLKTQVQLAVESRNIKVGKMPLLTAEVDDHQAWADIAASFQV
eukprot:c16908_g1_i1 orf=603-1640(-)